MNDDDDDRTPTDWFNLSDCIFFIYCVCLFPFAIFFHLGLCCATTYVGEKSCTYKKFCHRKHRSAPAVTSPLAPVP